MGIEGKFIGVARKKLTELLTAGGYNVSGLALESEGGRPCWINRFGVVLWPKHEHAWMPVAVMPPAVGEYLVVQVGPDGARRRKVRKWSGAAWVGISPDIYGPVVAWMQLPGMPTEEDGYV